MTRSFIGGSAAEKYTTTGAAEPFERIGLWGWVGLYVTGAVLLFFVLAHLFLVHFRASSAITAQATASLLQSPLITMIDFSVLVLAVTHGLLGARRVILDMEIFHARGRAWLTGILSLAGAVLILIGFLLLRQLTAPGS